MQWVFTMKTSELSGRASYFRGNYGYCMSKFLLLAAIFVLSSAGAYGQVIGVGRWTAPPDKRRCTEEPVALFDMSEKGQAAYNDLLKAEVFETGRVGFAGTLSPHVISLNMLLAEKDAAAALGSLLAGGTDAGRLYALSGLYYADRDSFDRGVSRLKDGEATVRVLKGCLMSEEKLGKIVESDAVNVAIIKPGQTMREFWESNAGGFELDIAHGGYPATFRESADIKLQDKNLR